MADRGGRVEYFRLQGVSVSRYAYRGRHPAAVRALHEQGKPAQRGALLHDHVFTIVAKYQAEYAGLVQYYLLAQDVFRLGLLLWVMETSLLNTLAGKHHSTVSAVTRKYKATIATPAGNELILRLLAERCEICEERRAWRSTTSASSPTSPGQAAGTNRRGCT